MGKRRGLPAGKGHTAAGLQENHHIGRLFPILLLALVGVIMLADGLMSFGLGFHNIDQSQNLMRLSIRDSSTIFETNTNGDLIPLVQNYYNGVELLLGSPLRMIGGVSLLWIAILLHVYPRK